ncbi:F-box and WD-40 domain-containing protein CDC4 [Anopheles sinensis]|uniref:F-box and WD-40 domain-containing protein CDC4 n=1 Tax=Anopheles sinensis TaxID=74873 RepID=A0A084W199_ANOSI|nr:F-box and WD-40 domain-containing protein CDC4 [Anopheles sinensis]
MGELNALVWEPSRPGFVCILLRRKWRAQEFDDIAEEAVAATVVLMIVNDWIKDVNDDDDDILEGSDLK